jgi:adenylate cyclase
MIKLTLQIGADAAPRELKGDVLSIGRSRFNDVALKDRKVSRLHARIEREGDEIRVVDLQSGNGTRLNGRKIAQHSLMAGDRIGIGPFVLTVLRAAAEPAPATPSEPSAGDVLNTTTMLQAVAKRRPGLVGA